MSVSLRTTLATLPSGNVLQDLSLDETSRYLRLHYYTQDETDREAHHLLRNLLYRDGGIEEMKRLIDQVYVDPHNREKRKQWAPYARYNNLTKKLVNALSTVYLEPAVRTVSSDEKLVAAGNNERYQMALALCSMHQVARRVSRMLNLHRALLVGPRVRRIGTARSPVLDVVTPDNVRLITHPNDVTQIVAVAIRMRTRTVQSVPQLVDASPVPTTATNPAWIVWSEHERFMMTEDWRIVSATYVEHDLGRIPYVFVSLEPPCETSPWPGLAGADIPNADLAVWFNAVCHLKETKSATRQTIVSGNLDGVARDQISDTEVPVEITDGTAITSHDVSMDVSMFRENSNHIEDSIANTYGMSGQQLRHMAQAESAAAREIMRAPLNELRREQQVILRGFERELAETMSIVFRRDMAEIGFTTQGWRIDFGEAQTPLTSEEELSRFETERRLCLTSTKKYLMARNPDLDEKAAEAELNENVQDELWRNLVTRPLQRVSGSMGAETPSPDDPADEQGEELAS